MVIEITDLDLIEQMFCEDEGILAKFDKVDKETINLWLEDKEYYNEIKW